MGQNEKKSPFRILVVITTPKIAEKISKLYLEGAIPVHYTLNAKGTASSEMMDFLGLGNPDKRILISILPKVFADKMIKKIYKELQFAIQGRGIAFSLPISGANNLILKMLKELDIEDKLQVRKEETEMTKPKNVLIATIVNQGYSEDVMNAARSQGAGGGTVLQSRRISNEQIMSFWGLSAQEEKEMILIVSSNESKLQIMKEISEKCGMNSEAKGIVLSLPIDMVTGIENLE